MFNHSPSPANSLPPTSHAYTHLAAAAALAPPSVFIQPSSTAQHKAKFEQEMYGIIRDVSGAIITGPDTSKIGPTSKSLTQEQYMERLHILKYWNNPKGDGEFESQKAFQKMHRQKYTNMKDLYRAVQKPNSNEVELWYVNNAPDDRNKWVRVVYIDQVADILSLNHQCGGVRLTKSQVAKKYSNITQKECSVWQSFCQTCNAQKIRQKKPKGCTNPIVSFAFRDRFQADLVDYASNPKRMFYWEDKSPLVRYLLVLKDHFTRLCFAAPIPQKTPQYVAYYLRMIFATIGYPLVFQTDNGKEFSDKTLLELLAHNPNMITVRGRPRTPRDQGSVERLNAPLKKHIDNLVAKKKELHLAWAERQIEATNEEVMSWKNASWATEYPMAVQILNSSTSYGPFGTQPYESVFGQDMRRPQLEAILETIKLSKNSLPDRTVSGFARHLPADWQQKMVNLRELKTNGSKASGDFFEHDNIELQMRSYVEEFSGPSSFFSSIKKKLPFPSPSLASLKLPPSTPLAPSAASAPLSAAASAPLAASVSSPVSLASPASLASPQASAAPSPSPKVPPSPCSSEDDLIPPASGLTGLVSKVIRNHSPETCMVVSPKAATPRKDKQNIEYISPTRAFKENRGVGMSNNGTHRCAFVPFDCKKCTFAGRGFSISLFEEKFYKACETTEQWWDGGFINTFVTLVAHAAHKNEMRESPTIQLFPQFDLDSIVYQQNCHELPPQITKMF